MDWRVIMARSWGIGASLIGVILIMLSGELGSGPSGSSLGLFDLSENGAQLMFRAGFGVFLIGLLGAFLFSFRMVPEELPVSIMLAEGERTGDVLSSLNLEGRGIYLPPRGRLTRPRVYIPLERDPLPIPELSDRSVFNVGTTSPSMGVSLVPPGDGIVRFVEETSKKRFTDDQPSDVGTSLSRLVKGTGLLKGAEMRSTKGSDRLILVHSKPVDVCGKLWERYPGLHERTGCPVCSAALEVTASVLKRPVRIRSVSRDGRTVTYELERL